MISGPEFHRLVEELEGAATLEECLVILQTIELRLRGLSVEVEALFRDLLRRARAEISHRDAVRRRLLSAAIGDGPRDDGPASSGAAGF